MTGVARAVWLFMRNPEKEDEFFMVRAKNNLTKRRSGLKYAINERNLPIVGSTPYIAWGGEVNMNADSILRGDDGNKKAEKFLVKALEGGERLATELYDEAARLGINQYRLRRAQRMLGVKTVQRSRRWWWSLPNAPQAAKSRENESAMHFNKSGHLSI